MIMSIIEINRRVIYILCAALCLVIAGKIGSIYFNTVEERNTNIFIDSIKWYASALQLKPIDYFIDTNKKDAYINLGMDISNLNAPELKCRLEGIGFKYGECNESDFSIEFLNANGKKETMFAPSSLWLNLEKVKSCLEKAYLNYGDNIRLAPLLEISQKKIKFKPSLSQRYGMRLQGISDKNAMDKKLSKYVIFIDYSHNTHESIAYDLDKLKEEKEIKERKFEDIKNFYHGYWEGFYTINGENKKLSIDLQKTYASISKEPHVQGILRLGYGAITKVNVEGKLREDGRIHLLDSNNISWDAGQYYDGTKRIAGSFKAELSGKIFEGKWFAEKKKETSDFKRLLTKKEERKLSNF